MAKKSNIYFDSFIKILELTHKGASFLHSTLSDFNPNEISSKVREIHLIEHNADSETHGMMEKLAKEFITPIEREDIIALARMFDDIVDSIEDVLQRVYMYNIQSIRDEAPKFTEIMVKSCGELVEVMKLFPNYRKNGEQIKKYLIDVNTLESDADKLYIDGVRRLFTQESDATVILAWKETFDKLEECCDNCENAAHMIESVIMKNS